MYIFWVYFYLIGLIFSAAYQLNAALKEAKDLFDFNENANRILQWISTKELILGAQDMGNDYEHAKSLLDKLIGS